RKISRCLSKEDIRTWGRLTTSRICSGRGSFPGSSSLDQISKRSEDFMIPPPSVENFPDRRIPFQPGACLGARQPIQCPRKLSFLVTESGQRVQGRCAIGMFREYFLCQRRLPPELPQSSAEAPDVVIAPFFEGSQDAVVELLLFAEFVSNLRTHF